VMHAGRRRRFGTFPIPRPILGPFFLFFTFWTLLNPTNCHRDSFDWFHSAEMLGWAFKQATYNWASDAKPRPGSGVSDDTALSYRVHLSVKRVSWLQYRSPWSDNKINEMKKWHSSNDETHAQIERRCEQFEWNADSTLTKWSTNGHSTRIT
jgi:hypothetical protein